MTPARHDPSQALRRLLRWCIALGVLLLAGAGLLYEAETHALQSRHFSRWAAEASYTRVDGPASATLPAPAGPEDHRRGYAGLPSITQRLLEGGYAITAQAQPSPRLAWLAGQGINPPYPEPPPRGLRLLDASAQVMYAQTLPAHAYSGFANIPPLVVATLLHIEDRHLLAAPAARNPAVQWDRFALAVGHRLLDVIQPGQPRFGSSTLATQLEKLRHSPQGLTADNGDKLRQMLSAALRAYRDGPDTRRARERLVVDYLNAIPLAATPLHGEIIGLGEGLVHWFGADPDAVNRLLFDAGDAPGAEHGLALRQVVALLLAQRRPAHWLQQAPDALRALTDAYLRALQRDGVVPPALAEQALAAEALPVAQSVHPDSTSALRATRALRHTLVDLLGAQDLHALDRLDLIATTTLDGAGQLALEQDWRDETARRPALRLVELHDTGRSLRLDAGEDGARRVTGLAQAAHLRTLVAYLSLVADIHQRYAVLDAVGLRSASEQSPSRLAHWGLDYLRSAQRRDLAPMLAAALDRLYSADPDAGFGLLGRDQTFRNSDQRHDRRAMSLREAWRDGAELVFVRLLAEIIEHLRAEDQRGLAVQHDPNHPARLDYLRRYVDHEIVRAATHYDRYPDGRDDGSDDHPVRDWVAAYRATHPDAALETLLAEAGTLHDGVFAWLFHDAPAERQGRAIDAVRDLDALDALAALWARQGYTLSPIPPTLGVALGAAPETSRTLEHLLGAIAGGGPLPRVTPFPELEFARGTPYEIILQRGVSELAPGLRPEVAAQAAQLLERRETRVNDQTLRGLGEVGRSGDGQRAVIGFTLGTRYYGSYAESLPDDAPAAAALDAAYQRLAALLERYAGP